MNKICNFRLCKLSDEELIKKIDSQVDKIYKDGKIPARHIPAKPDEDFDLLIGELLLRYKEITDGIVYKTDDNLNISDNWTYEEYELLNHEEVLIFSNNNGSDYQSKSRLCQYEIMKCYDYRNEIIHMSVFNIEENSHLYGFGFCEYSKRKDLRNILIIGLRRGHQHYIKDGIQCQWESNKNKFMETTGESKNDKTIDPEEEILIYILDSDRFISRESKFKDYVIEEKRSRGEDITNMIIYNSEKNSHFFASGYSVLSKRNELRDKLINGLKQGYIYFTCDKDNLCCYWGINQSYFQVLNDAGKRGNEAGGKLRESIHGEYIGILNSFGPQIARATSEEQSEDFTEPYYSPITGECVGYYESEEHYKKRIKQFYEKEK